MNKVELPQVQSEGVRLADFQRALTGDIAGEVRFDRLSRGLYSTDASVYQIVPHGVIVPKTLGDVQAALRHCTAFGIPITARGGGTSQAGQCIGPGIILDFSKYFDRILEINPQEGWARVEPGVVLDELNRQARPHGLCFAPDISTSNRATIGGMVANNSSGTHSVIHGKTIDHVLSLKALLSDGSLIQAGPMTQAQADARSRQPGLEGACYKKTLELARTHASEIEHRYPKILRRVGGYNLDLFVPGKPINLANLLVGSEGTLAITVEAKVKLIPLPKARGLVVLHFDTLLDALGATPGLLDHGPAAIEVMDRFILDSTLLNPESRRLREFLVGEPGAILLVEFYADGADALPARLDAAEQALRASGYQGAIVKATDVAQQDRVWKLRKFALGLSMAEKGDAKAISFVEDTAVDPRHLRDFIGEFVQIIEKHGTTAGIYAHASVGCLHVRPVINLKTQEGVERFESLAAAVADLVLKYGGALSGEHGDGLVRSPFMEKMFGPSLYQAFRELKQTFDPQGLFNPGKIVDAPPLSNNLRYGPAYVTPDVPTTFDFTEEGGLTRAAELCAGVGECRKKRPGTMCPSYQATGEELHSTRGRANTLRLALTGQLDFAGLSDPALHDAFDLCLECKACKTECPTNVDMAKLKAEFLHQYFRDHRMPWRNRIFGRVGTGLSSWGMLTGLVNWWTASSPGRWLHEKMLGIDRRRTPPQYARRTFSTLHKSRPNPADAKVLMFVDSFVNYFTPSLGDSALAVLDHFGVKTHLGLRDGSFVCCGRPQISNGLLDEAVACARHNVARLYPFAERGLWITALEPSCILTIKDDYPSLLRGEGRRQAEVVAKQCRTVEACLVCDNGMSLSHGANKVLVQGHCHERSLVGMAPTMKLLSRLPQTKVIDVDAGCCGLAGSFGYEIEHYDVSRLVGEQRLFPTLRQADGDTLIAASGFSCRMQIRHFAGREALHPIEIIAQAIRK